MNFSVFTYTGLASIHARHQKVTASRFKTTVRNQRSPFANQENHPHYTNEHSFIDLKYGMKNPACMKRQAGFKNLDAVYNQRWLHLSPCRTFIQLLRLGISNRGRLTSLGDNPSCAFHFFGYFIHVRDGELWRISICT